MIGQRFSISPLVVGWSNSFFEAFKCIITGVGTSPWLAQTTQTILCVCVCVDTHLQVRSLSSSWRSLQCSSVCLQEHRQVTGSCTNRRFLFSGQWSQHGPHFLRWGKSERDRLMKSTLSPFSSRGHPSVCSVVYSCSLFPITGGRVCWWASVAHGWPPSRQASRQ